MAQETAKGLKWTLLNKLTVYPLQLAYGMLLARLLTPTEMGIVGLTAIFFAIANTLKDSGFGMALVRKQDRTEADCSTVFWFNVGMSLIFAVTLFLLAPWFAEWYHQPELLWLTRVSAILMFPSGSAGVHWNLYNARRDFKTPAIIHVCVTIVSLPATIYLAYIGWGVWALLAQSVMCSVLSLIIVWIVSPWRPKSIFSKQFFKEYFLFGSKLALSSLLDTGYNNLRSFFIGKVYSPAQLAFYQRGRHLANVGPTTACGIIGQVTFPILATIQHVNARLKQVYRQYLRLFTLVIVWDSMLVAAMADSFIRLMYAPQWAEAVPYAQILCFSYALWHIQIINLNLLQVKDYLPLSLLAIACAWIPGSLAEQLPCHYIIKLAVGGLASAALYYGILRIRKDETLLQLLGLLQGRCKKPWLAAILNKLGW